MDWHDVSPVVAVMMDFIDGVVRSGERAAEEVMAA
jgi:hypothetical protein